MNRQFSLAGLLRIRKIQQDQAASSLARATSRSRSIRVREAHARNQLDDTAEPVTGTAALRAVAASRAAAQGLLAELQALADIADAEAAEAQTLFTEARTKSVSLEKLEARHRAEYLAAEMSAEQGALDEVASIAWHRDASQADSRRLETGRVRR
jgi:flagellar protein FliJ